MEELRNYEVEELENETEETEVSVEVEETGGVLLRKFVTCMIVTAIGAGAYITVKQKDKIKNKINEKRAEKLAKAGYAVYGPGEVIEEVEAEVEEEDSEEATE